MTKPFRHLRDPVFLGALALFALNQLVLKRAFPFPFILHHFNDLLLVPCALPLLLRLHVALGLRPEGQRPTAWEIIAHLAVWSLLFELAGPHLAAHSTGDWRDILCYWIGGGCAWILWNVGAPATCPGKPA